MKKNTKTAIWILVFVAVIGLLIFINPIKNTYFDVSETCNLGSWGISSYDAVHNSLVINYDLQAAYPGCMGIGNLSKDGIPVLNTQQLCEQFGFTWRSPDQVPNGGYPCYMAFGNTNWIQGKDIVASGSCTHTRPYLNPSPDGFTPTFDGITMTFPNLKRQGDDDVHCSGTFTILSIQRDSSLNLSPIGTTQSSNTELYIALGVLAVLIVLIVLYFRRKK